MNAVAAPFTHLVPSATRMCIAPITDQAIDAEIAHMVSVLGNAVHLRVYPICDTLGQYRLNNADFENLHSRVSSRVATARTEALRKMWA